MKNYCAKITNPERAIKARTDNLRCSYKNTYELARFLKGRYIKDAIKICEGVMEKTQIVPFRKYDGGVGRQKGTKRYGTNIGRWPVKSAKFLLKLLVSAVNNAKNQDLDLKDLLISHMVVQRAPIRRRRTYKAHGKVSRFDSHPCHVEVILSLKIEDVDEMAGVDTNSRMKASLLKHKVTRLMKKGNSIKEGATAYKVEA